MKKILGLDLGVTSIGWAILAEDNNKKEIVGMGSRIIPLSTDDKDEFTQGNAISKNQKRTIKRTQRKGYDRYQMRRKALTRELIRLNMFDEKLFQLKQLDLWYLRSRAVSEKITLPELGRVLYHLNQKRGYKSSRSDANKDKKETEYVAEVKNRHQQLRDEGQTIGQKFYAELKKNEFYRIKQQVFPREAYIEEFDSICAEQQRHHNEILNNAVIEKLRNEIIYFQRKLKSQKGLVSFCEFERFVTKNSDGKESFAGPKVTPRSSPLFQVCKIWESINSLSIQNRLGEKLVLSIDQKQKLFEYLDIHEKLTAKELFKILELKEKEGWYTNKQIERGIQGNTTKSQILKIISSSSPHLQFKLTISSNENKECHLVDRKTGEINESLLSEQITDEFATQPLYKLWHTIYSISDQSECTKALIQLFGFETEIAQKLANIDFTKSGFGNKSAKAIRKMLPYLMKGYVYSDACSFAGYNHSDSLTRSENTMRLLLTRIPNLSKNSLRQPVVEKILNQMINVVNSLIEKHGQIDEIRVELARELKQSKDERNETFANLNRRERENESIRKRITDEYGLRATRNNVIKWRLFHEIMNEESKLNATCIYCGKPFGLADTLSGNSIDVEHIIPKALLFDDSQSNKTLSHRSCNELKAKRTAFDFMASKGNEELEQYVDRVNHLFKNRLIKKAKRDKLLMTEGKIPQDFIDRQLRQTQYIAKKSKEILEQVCRNVWSTSGSITEYLRRIWGWDDVLMNLQLPKYREAKLTEWVEWQTNNGQIHREERIKDWSKRDDHRHHAIDALTIACTQQGFIQRINKLSADGNRREMYEEVGKTKNQNLLEAYMVSKRPFTTKEVEMAVDQVLISFKAGKKVATFGNRKIKRNGKKQIVQTKIIIPRGALSEESVYGKIKVVEKNKPVKYLFENSDLIFKPRIKALVVARLQDHEGDVKKAIQSLKKNPIFLDGDSTIELKFATCFKEEYVIKYPIETIKAKDLDYVVDRKIRQLIKERLELHGNKEKEAFKTPLYFDNEQKQPIRSVRMLTGLSSVVPVSKDSEGRETGFVKPGNNHHIAFYIDENGNKTEHGCTFWHAVERKKYGIPVIIKNPKEVWDKILLAQVDYPQDFLSKLPTDKWIFDESLQQNEMFILGLLPDEIDEAIFKGDQKLLGKYIYRVQKMSIKGNGSLDMTFRHQYETTINDTSDAKNSLRFYNIQSIKAFEKLNPHKIRVSSLGEIFYGKNVKP